MTTPEGRVKKKVKKLLNEYKEDFHLWEYWPVPSGFGRRTVDVIGLFFGRAFAIEVKRPGKEPTELQDRELAYIAICGGDAFIIDGDEGIKQLRQWLDSVIASEFPDDEHAIIGDMDYDPHQSET